MEGGEGLVAAVVPNENCRIKQLCWPVCCHEGEEKEMGVLV